MRVRTRVRVCVRTDFWKCEVRACNAKNGHNPCLVIFCYFSYQLLNFCLGFSAVPKTWKNSNVLNTLLEFDISRALFFKILTTLPNLHMYYLPKVMKSQNMKRTKHTTLILTFMVWMVMVMRAWCDINSLSAFIINEMMMLEQLQNTVLTKKVFPSVTSLMILRSSA